MYPGSIRIEPSKKEPWVIFEPGRIFIMGRSIPENAGEFYKPLLEWVTKYSENGGESVRMEFGFEFINTSSIKWIYSILKKLSAMKDIVRRARVVWYYEQGDEDMCELGLILKAIINCPFGVVEVDDMHKERYEQILAGSP